jgi:hypothetical protein
LPPAYDLLITVQSNLLAIHLLKLTIRDK